MTTQSSDHGKPNRLIADVLFLWNSGISNVTALWEHKECVIDEKIKCQHKWLFHHGVYIILIINKHLLYNDMDLNKQNSLPVTLIEDLKKGYLIFLLNIYHAL